MPPLKDAFSKNPTDSQERDSSEPLKEAPSIEDLRYNMLKAQREVGRPIILSWIRKDVFCLLTVTLAVGAADPTWIFHVGREEESAIVWIYTSSDTALIHSMIMTIDQAEMTKPPAEAPPEKAAAAVKNFDDGQPLPHEEFSDKYELINRLGHGGMGVIYKARRKDDQEIIALKVLHEHLLNDPDSKRRFEQEAAACRDLKHRNLIRMLEFGFSKHGQPYMTMEYLEGRQLTDLIASKGRLEVRKFINIFTQICDGLNHAHQKGVVHRDVKPSNIMVIRSDAGVDIAKILDFGIAKRQIEENKDKLTQTGNVLGSPAYISPEQCAGQNADPRSDIYSLGCVMYEALTGNPPFVHDSAIKVLLMQLSETPQSLSVACPDAQVPYELETIVMRCIEKDPAERYQNASELGADLWTFAATGQRGVIPGAVPEGSEAPLAREAAAAGSMLSKLDGGPQAGRERAGVPPPPMMNMAPSTQPSYLSAPMPVPMPASIEAQLSRLKKVITLRFKRFRGPFEMEVIWEGLNLARNLQRKEANVSILLDLESVCLVLKPDVVAARFNFDHPMVKKLSAMQSMLQQLIKEGATVIASERWAKRGSESLQQLMPGVLLCNDEELADLIIERYGSIIEY
jgi:serine/threonine protein kinase